MKYRFLLSCALLLAIALSSGGCRSTNTFSINADQTVNVNVKNMPITAFFDLVNETYEHSEAKFYPLFIVSSKWKINYRETEINSEPLISLKFHSTSISNVLSILSTQYVNVSYKIGIASKNDPNRIPLSQGGGNFVKWKGSGLEGMAGLSQAVDFLRTALGNSVNVKIEVLPEQLQAFSDITFYCDNPFPVTVNEYVLLIELAFPVRFDFTNECIVIRFNKTWPKEASFQTYINKQPSPFKEN